MNPSEWHIFSLSELPKLAQDIISSLKNVKVWAFYGEMGSGKTTLIREICHFLQVKDVVTSPTFAIVNEYKTQQHSRIYHFDFYRINNISEAFDLGYEEYFYSGNFCFIEWPEKISALLPENTGFIHINRLPDDSRIVHLELPAGTN